ncbi:MAG: hypothetical protein LH649_12220 [Pseudanabaena sp. CAN_BIN31]|nr:hypothetical protein [Pseudanabaena sp. CAN_BIN31]
MIISFSDRIFQTQNYSIQSKLADILIELIKKDNQNHFIETKSVASIFFNDENRYIFNENEIAKEYLSNARKRELEEYINNILTKPITKLYRDYLTHFTIGINSTEVHPNDAYRIIMERSLIVIENNPNDWKFITGMIDKYQSYGIRKNIYKLIKKSLDSPHYLTYDHAGGSGIKSQIESWVNGVYQNIYKFKLMVLFDSDKKNENDFKQEYKNLFEYLKAREISIPPSVNDLIYEENDLIVWHMLFKRCIENYIPIDIIIENITDLTDIHKSNLKRLSPSEIDFIQYYKPEGKPKDYYISIGKNKAKEQFPNMFLAPFSYDSLEQRCEHHKVGIQAPAEKISEIEEILLKIAKII